jgi:hypothetical protein
VGRSSRGASYQCCLHWSVQEGVRRGPVPPASHTAAVSIPVGGFANSTMAALGLRDSKAAFGLTPPPVGRGGDRYVSDREPPRERGADRYESIHELERRSGLTTFSGDGFVPQRGVGVNQSFLGWLRWIRTI